MYILIINVPNGSREYSTDNRITFVDVLLCPCYEIICQWLNRHSSRVSQTVDLCFLFGCYAFENAPRKSLFVFTGEFCCAKNGCLSYRFNKLIYSIVTTLVGVNATLWVSADAS